MMDKVQSLRSLQERIGYSFQNPALLEQAVSHSSYVNEHRKILHTDNERLEFLGDAVLELTTSDFLFREYPDMPEGEMTKLRASLVCEPTLAMCARELSLPECLLLGRGEECTGGRGRDSVVSDAMEAVIGAIYLDGGFEKARAFVRQFILNDIDHKKLFFDSKTHLQEIVQSEFRDESVRYELVREEGPAHARRFVSQVMIGERILGEGSGSTKKGAEQEAAYRALLALAQAGITPGRRI